MTTVHECCSNMFAEWDQRWSQAGLDGISIDAVFDSPGSESRKFSIWSPRSGTAPHNLLAAALECLPFEHCQGREGELIEILRSYFGLQPAVTIVNRDSLVLRLAPWVNPKDATDVESKILMLPDQDLLIDISGVERFSGGLARILPLVNLLDRKSEVRWIARKEFADALIQFGFDQSKITVVPYVPLSPIGEPIVLGGIFISSTALVSLAKAGEKIALIRALRNEYPLTLEQASRAAAELLEIVVTHPGR